MMYDILRHSKGRTVKRYMGGNGLVGATECLLDSFAAREKLHGSGDAFYLSTILLNHC